MEFANEFIVPAAPADAWVLLTDVPRIAPCLPGATVNPVGDGTYEGSVGVKVGPIKVGYSGTATFTELDESKHRMVLSAGGKESSGKGSANATVTVELVGEGTDKTRVLVATDLQVTGKVAQFGRSAMADVGARLIGQFASNLEAMITSSRAGAQTFGADRGETQSAPQFRPAPQEGGSELDALALAWPFVKRGVPATGAFVLGALLGWLVSRRR